ncbi:ATP phosphoribosyltransferase [Marinomonas mediterranea]|jgi:ATP phosphoribosyltransferase (homohexameric) (EC 2.4.2.17)|nr:ATP phosphoribosyltransferase [Marinomonas mediterranea]WCN09080.1 ATP phosphoribosyltransferase [Marinomonas mediterranea]WCN13111.1 ATP phosphoribosyltransferase [Marinomonas mediterranea]WCN17182.1 ATP phosphoribosyltransferase [Marinomonas mediterranea MMB-1]
MKETLTIALSKGRILDETLPLFEKANIIPAEDMKKSRKLIFDTNHLNIKLVLLRATDVPTYVEHGVADFGVAGKDVLMEAGAKNLYELLDLEISKCRLMTAGVVGEALPNRRLKVASKFSKTAKSYFAEQGIQADVIKLYGAMELAPIMGLADLIVDIVDTGNTLRANGLEARDLIANISTRLVVNKAAYKTKYEQIEPIIEMLRSAVRNEGE